MIAGFLPLTVFRELLIINLPGLIIAVAAGCLQGKNGSRVKDVDSMAMSDGDTWWLMVASSTLVHLVR